MPLELYISLDKINSDYLIEIYTKFCTNFGIELKENDERFLREKGIEALNRGRIEYIPYFGAKFFDAGKNLLTNEQATNKARVGEEVNYKIDFRSTDFISSKAGQELPWLSWIPRELAKQEDNLRSELATEKDINKLMKTARAVGLLYKSKDNKEIRNRLNTFLMEYYNIKYDKR